MAPDLDRSKNLFWFGIDKNYCIARFEARDIGFIPASVEANFEEHLALEDRLSELPDRFRGGGFGTYPQPRTLSEQADYLADLVHWSDVGVFTFLADTAGPKASGLKGYRRIAWPDEPILVSALDKDVRTVLKSVRFDADFAVTEAKIGENQLMPGFR